VKRKNSEDADKLSIVVYDACNDDKSKNFVYEEEKLDWLKDQGFDVVYHERVTLDPKYIIALRDRLSTDRFEEIPYDIDGLVIKDNIVDLKDCERDRPTKQIAFKFILNEAQTTVRGIDFSVAGKTRTPVAICDPVYLCGTTVTRANLCNLGLIKESNLRIGSKVIMVKRGEIIPKIERVIETPSDCKEVNFPTFCEFCGSPLTITDTTIFCPNLQCPETQKHRITTWAKVNKIYGLGPQIVSLLYDSKLVTRIFDLYTPNASVESLSTVISPKIAAKLVDQINKTRELSLAKFIAGFDLDGIGETTVINICQVIPQIYDLDTILAMKVSHLAEAPGFGYKAATNIVSELQTHKDELIELSTAVKIKAKKMPDYSSDKKGVPHLYDCVLAFTGPLFTMSREEAVEKVRECGGRVVSNVTPLVNYVVSNEKESSNKKFITAKKLGIQIINEEEFKHLLEGTF
jgi:DNA ligase (NAD+)